MVTTRFVPMVLAWAGLLVAAPPALAQTPCASPCAGGTRISISGISVSQGLAVQLPDSASSRDAADMSEESAQWQTTHVSGAQEGTGSVETRASQRRGTVTRTRQTTHATSQRRHRASATRRTSHTNRVRQTSQHQPRDYNPVIDRARLYGAGAVGATTSVTSWSGRGESWHSGTVTHWVVPAQWNWQMAATAYGGQSSQMCGWGYRIDSAPGSATSQQQVWLCQCPAGWRPPGWQHPY